MVNARHLLGAGIVVSVAIAVGCASKPRAASRSRAAATAAKPDAPPAVSGAPGPLTFEPAADGAPHASDAASADSADVTPRSLAQHTEHYARNLESMLSRRPGVAKDAADSTVYSTNPPLALAPDSSPKDPIARANAPMQVEAAPQETMTNTDSRDRVLAPRNSSVETVKPQPSARQPAAAPRVGSPVKTSAEAQAASAGEKAKPQAAATRDLAQQLAGKIKDDPRDTVSHLHYQLLQFLLDEQVPDLSTIASLPAEDRELLTTLLDGLANFRTGLRADANSLQSKKVAPLLELADRLRSQGELTISTAALCNSVSRFGVYEPMEPPRFIAGSKDNVVVLYCEVANFSSQLNDRKLWETRLKQEAVLYSETGLAVWADKSDVVTDLSRNRLHDFFIADKVRLPANLPVGRYLMKMTVTDLHASRVAEATVPIQVVAQ